MINGTISKTPRTDTAASVLHSKEAMVQFAGCLELQLSQWEACADLFVSLLEEPYTNGEECAMKAYRRLKETRKEP